MVDYSFTLRTMLSVKDTVSTLTAKTDRLISDVEKHNDKIDKIQGDMRFVKGAAWVIGIIIAAAWSTIVYLVGRMLAQPHL